MTISFSAPRRGRMEEVFPQDDTAVMPVPPIGALLFFEGKRGGWRVTDVQFQYSESLRRFYIVNVLLRRVRDSAQ